MSNDKTDLLTRIAPPPAYPRASTAAPDGGITGSSCLRVC